MKKNIFMGFILLVFLVSCDGLLWDGIDSSSGDLSISIESPHASVSDYSTSRYLASGDTYLYVELARIDDLVAYNLDKDKAVTGDGVWTKTSWGAHAVLTHSLENAFVYVGIFKDVPRDKDIRARVFQDADLESIIMGINDDGIDDDDLYYQVESSPLSSTSDEFAEDLFDPYSDGDAGILDKCWVTVTASDLQKGIINFTLVDQQESEPW